MPYILIAGFGLALLASVFFDGGVEPYFWHLAIIAIGGLCILVMVRPKTQPLRPWPLTALLAGVAAIALLQIIPLPVGVIGVLSPARAALVSATAPLLGAATQAPLAVTPPAATDRFLTLLAYIAAFFAIRGIARSPGISLWLLVLPLMIVSAGEAVLGLTQFQLTNEIARGTYVNRNHFAGLLEMCLPLFVLWAVYSARAGVARRPLTVPAALAISLGAGGAALLLAAIILCESRMGFVAALASMFVPGLAYVLKGRSASHGRSAGVTALIVLLIVAAAFLPTIRLLNRFADITTKEELSSDERFQLWRETLPLVRTYWLAGTGLGGYESAFMKFKAVGPTRNADFAHNDYLQLAAELGIPGFLLLLAIAGVVLFRTVDSTGPHSRDRYLALACLGSLTAILLHSFVDFNLYIPANGLVAVWIGAVAHET